MMTILFCGMILSGILLGGLTGRMPQVSQAAIEQSGEAVRLTLSLLGNFCLWGGMMKVAEQSGLTRAAARAFAPLTRRLFRGIDNFDVGVKVGCDLDRFYGLHEQYVPS